MTRVRINDVAIDVAIGTTLLDAVEAAAVPIASECGGSGRCGLCRVRVVSGSSRLSPMDRVEREALGDEAGDKAFDHDDFEPPALPGLSVVKL